MLAPEDRAGPVRVLVIDDHDEARAALVDVLLAWGHVVADVAAGRDGLARGLWFRPDVVITDLTLPDMDGCAVAEAFQAPPWASRCPLLVAYTGWAGPEDRQRAEAAGFDLVLVKPHGLDDLERVLSEIRNATRAALK